MVESVVSRNAAGDHDIDAYEGWDIERGDSTTVLGVTDTGVLYAHADLTIRVWRNWPEMNGMTDVDDDGNGFVDDSVGWDFVSASGPTPAKTVPPPTPIRRISTVTARMFGHRGRGDQ